LGIHVTVFIQDDDKKNTKCAYRALLCINNASCSFPKEYDEPNVIRNMVKDGCVPLLVDVLKKPNSTHPNLEDSSHYYALNALDNILEIGELTNNPYNTIVQGCSGTEAIAMRQVYCSIGGSICVAIWKLTFFAGLCQPRPNRC
jgi:hypothetical protein